MVLCFYFLLIILCVVFLENHTWNPLKTILHSLKSKGIKIYKSWDIGNFRLVSLFFLLSKILQRTFYKEPSLSTSHKTTSEVPTNLPFSSTWHSNTRLFRKPSWFLEFTKQHGNALHGKVMYVTIEGNCRSSLSRWTTTNLVEMVWRIQGDRAVGDTISQ